MRPVRGRRRARVAAALALVGVAAAAASPALATCGDVSGNGVVQAADALQILKRAVGIEVAFDCGPPAPPLTSGQTKCYNSGGLVVACEASGQDGEFQLGVAPDYGDGGDGTIFDRSTGLVWEKLGDDGSIHDKDTALTWEQALAKVASLNQATFAGHDDWRLPSAFELMTLADFGRAFPELRAEFRTPCSTGCSALTCSCVSSSRYWSSTTAAITSRAWMVGFSSMPITQHAAKSSLYRARAVRGATWPAGGEALVGGAARGAARRNAAGTGEAPASAPSPATSSALATASTLCGDTTGDGSVAAADALAALRFAVGQNVELRCTGLARTLATGQEACFDAAGAEVACAGSNQDGETMLGAPRSFVDLGDGTVFDPATDLTWEKLDEGTGLHGSGAEYTWLEALAKADDANAAAFAGHDDWRLPNIVELMTLRSPGLGSGLASAFDDDCVAEPPACETADCSCTPTTTWSSTTAVPDPVCAWWLRRDSASGPYVSFNPKTTRYGARLVRGGR